MGCQFSQSNHVRVPIRNSIVHLIQTEQNKVLMEKLVLEDEELFGMRLNFKGDTIMHYACIKNNEELVRFLKKKGADFTIKNDNNQIPSDLTKNEKIIRIIGLDFLPTCDTDSQRTKPSPDLKPKDVLGCELDIEDVKIFLEEQKCEGNSTQITSSQSLDGYIAEQEAEQKYRPKNFKTNTPMRRYTH